MTEKGTKCWVDSLAEIVDEYKNSPHCALGGLTPTQASEPEHETSLRDYQYGRYTT